MEDLLNIINSVKIASNTTIKTELSIRKINDQKYFNKHNMMVLKILSNLETPKNSDILAEYMD